MPILGKLPVLGDLFGGETGAQRETQIVFVLTPTILAASDSALALARQTADVMAKAKGEIATAPPPNPLGFDQWLLGSE